MSATLSKIWIHVIFSTKNRKNLITPQLEKRLYAYIRKQLYETGCILNIVNGSSDHIHCLFLMNAQMSIADTVKHIKGSTSHFINYNNLTEEKFSWQTGYTAYSISESIVSNVFKYIQHQKYVHEKITLEEETEEYTAMHLFNNIFNFDTN